MCDNHAVPLQEYLSNICPKVSIIFPFLNNMQIKTKGGMITSVYLRIV